MKKTLSLILVLLLCVSMLAGCSKDTPKNDQVQNDQPQAGDTQNSDTQNSDTQSGDAQENAPQDNDAQNNEEQEEAPVIVKTFTLEKEQLIAENVSPYDGLYLEYGDVETVSGLCAVKFTNTADQTIQEAQLIFSDGTQELSFWMEMLPAGQSVIVAEQNQKVAASEQLRFVDGTVTYLDSGLENVDAVRATSTGNNLVKVENITEEMLPLVRVFYRSTDQDGTPLGGLCRSVMVDGIDAGTVAMVEAENWDETSVVVTVLVINE